MTLPIAPLEASAIAALRSVLLGMFDPATKVVGSASGTTLAVSSVASGAIAPNMALTGPGLVSGAFVQQFLTGRGGAGTYQLSAAALVPAPQGSVFTGGFDVVRGQVNRVASPAAPDYAVLWPTGQIRLATNVDGSADCKFEGSIAGGVLTVTQVDIGALSIGALAWGASGLADGTRIVAQTSGTAGGVGAYVVVPNQTAGAQMMACGQKSASQEWQMTVQIDVHGPNSGDNATRVSTLLRDEYATSAFSAITATVSPLHADDPKQIPFVNDQNQYEDRWVVVANLQVNSAILLPQQYMDAAVVGMINVDAAYPPH